MILSFHPIIEAHRNIVCAGREPNDEDLAAIRKARAVILPQGCHASLYRMARDNCRHIFPNMDARFDYPCKCGQARLFERLNAPRPLTRCYESVAAYHRSPWEKPFPAVVKLDWGGEGDTVFKVRRGAEMIEAVEAARRFESSGQQGFLVQQFVDSGNRSLRVVVVGSHLQSYWRVQPVGSRFGTAVAKGAQIEYHADPVLQRAARAEVRRICRQTGIQLAGFDFLFDIQALDRGHVQPLVLEINYFFGRSGIGGSETFYRLLEQEVDRWLARLELKR